MVIRNEDGLFTPAGSFFSREEAVAYVKGHKHTAKYSIDVLPIPIASHEGIEEAGDHYIIKVDELSLNQIWADAMDET
jgi:hypothetical protein